MQKTGITGLNKNQKIWITDRYLTYRYLDMLKYGNFDKIKEQVNKDINNIKKVTIFEKIKSVRKIILKEAYDLYKMQIKFEEFISNVKNGELDINEFKLLVTGASFIFNFYKNKNQYKKDMSKAMQYAFWQSIIEVGGKYAGFDFSADLLQHSLKEKPENLYFTSGKVVEKIKSDKIFVDELNKIIQEYEKKNKNQINEDTSIVLSKSDLFYSINKAEFKVKGNKQNGKWNLNINIYDVYDYTKLKTLKEYFKATENVKKSIFSSSLYNFAYFSMKTGVLNEFEVNINFDIEV